VTLLLVTSPAPALAQDEDATGADLRTPTPGATTQKEEYKTNFSDEIFKKRVSPAKLKSDKPVEEFLQPVYNPNAEALSRPEKKEPNFANKIIEFFANLIAGEQGFVNFIRPGKSPSWGEGETGIGLAAQDLQKSLYPAGFSPSRSTFLASFPASALSVQSGELKEIFQKAASSQCVPLPMLLAIAKTETPGIFEYSQEDVRRFTTPGWWEQASQEERGRGYCSNTCEKPGYYCEPGYTDVQGPMQFSRSTWDGYLPKIKSALQSSFGLPSTYEPERCNLRDPIVGAALKLKADSGTEAGECNSWPEAAVKRAASAYFGGCVVAWAEEPWNYCDRVWELYLNYSTR
ncbi:MAG: hypothetical protein HY377_02240, partial [Candidatus Blackburnbacteria bacterium]|nr:hypothetical protein [Candidatus Blackburnbacteria bacterium]